MAEYQASGDVKISRVDDLEVIAIVEDWREGEEMSKERKHYSTGFIGFGFTKRGIYVRSLSRIHRFQLNSLQGTI